MMPWKPGSLLTNEYYDVYLSYEALQFEPITLRARYMAVIQITDDILERLCQIESRQ